MGKKKKLSEYEIAIKKLLEDLEMAFGRKKESHFGVVKVVKNADYVTKTGDNVAQKELTLAFESDGVYTVFEGRVVRKDYDAGAKGIPYDELKGELVGQTVGVVADCSPEYPGNVQRVIRFKGDKAGL